MAESTAYMIASKYGLDTQEYRFDYIPDEVNGADGKDLSELFNPITQNGKNEINKVEKNINNSKSKDKASVIIDLKEHKKAIDNNNYTGKKVEVNLTKKPIRPKDK